SGHMRGQQRRTQAIGCDQRSRLKTWNPCQQRSERCPGIEEPVAPFIGEMVRQPHAIEPDPLHLLCRVQQAWPIPPLLSPPAPTHESSRKYHANRRFTQSTCAVVGRSENPSLVAKYER